MDVAELTLDHFSSRVGERFRLEAAEGRAASLELVEAEELPSRGDSGAGSFSILLRNPEGPPFSQGTQKLAHEELGTIALFIVPVRSDKTGTYYEAIFTRMS